LLVIAGVMLDAVVAVPVKLPTKVVEVTEVSPVIVDAKVKLSVPSTAKLVPAKSVNKLP
jgi:hypothetical protein